MKKVMHEGVEIAFDDMEFKHLERVDYSNIYECRGFDAKGNIYSGIVEKCCDEYCEIKNIDLIMHSVERPSMNFDSNPPIIGYPEY